MNAGYFVGRSSDFLLILDFSEFESSFRRLCKLLEVDAVLPRDDLAAHRNPANLPRHLSRDASANLTRWYAPDLSFVELCGKLGCFAGNEIASSNAPG